MNVGPAAGNLVRAGHRRTPDVLGAAGRCPSEDRSGGPRQGGSVTVQTRPPARPGQAQTVLGLMTAVAILDQTTKYWGWRHVSRAVINPGSTWLVGAPLSGLYSGARTGPLMDLVSCGLLSLAVVVLVRRRRSAVVLVSGALMIGGWSSNLLD